MGRRKIIIRQSVADRIAEIAWYIEATGMLATAEKFSDDVYDFLEKLSDQRKSYRLCSDPTRASMGFKCVIFRKKYTIVFVETRSELTICEFIPTKLIHW